MKDKIDRLALMLCVLLTGIAAVFAGVGGNGISGSESPVPTPNAAEEKAARASFKKLLDLQAALKKIPRERYELEPNKSFFKSNEKQITYSEPAAEYYVRSELFWELHAKYKALPIAEDIAWTAAQNPLPGECEGYVNCILYVVISTDAKYLSFYPSGKYAKKALQNVIEFLTPMADPADRVNYAGPTDNADKAELKKMLEELNATLDAVAGPERSKTLSLSKQIEVKFK